MTAHRHWMLRLTSRSISYQISLATVELRETLGGADLAAAATRIETPLAVTAWWDGSDATSSSNFTSDSRRHLQTVRLDLGAAKEIKEIRLRTSSNGALAPATVQLLHSDDGASWTATSLYGELPASAAADTDYLFSGWTFGVPFALRKAQLVRRLSGGDRPSPAFLFAAPVKFARDNQDGGRGQIVGTVKKKATPVNLPVVWRVRLFHEFSARCIRETWSDPAGNYAFKYLDETQRYTVTAYDPTKDDRGEIADNLLPELMP